MFGVPYYCICDFSTVCEILTEIRVCGWHLLLNFCWPQKMVQSLAVSVSGVNVLWQRKRGGGGGGASKEADVRIGEQGLFDNNSLNMAYDLQQSQR